MISSKYTIREQNESLVLNTIINSDYTSRAEISQITSLNKATVSEITKKLIDDKLVRETGIGLASSAGGRKPIMLQFNGKSALSISLDVGYNYIEGILSYIDTSVISSISLRNLSISSDNIIKHIQECISFFIKKKTKSKHGIVGISIAIHGIVYENNILFTPNYDLENIDLNAELKKIVDFPIYIENEANLAALGEYTFSSSYSSLISFNVHSGIGAGIVENGELQTGIHGMGGEIGHSILFPSGKKCECGNQGCIELYASSKAIYERFKKSKNLTLSNSDIIREFYKMKDEFTYDLIKENCLFLSIGINNIISMYDPEIILINSSLFRKIPDMITLVKENIKGVYASKVTIKESELGENAILFGGIALCAQNFLNVKNLKFTSN